VVSISTDSISVAVPGGCRPQGCHGYLHVLLKAHILAGSTIPKALFPSSSICDDVDNLLDTF